MSEEQFADRTEEEFAALLKKLRSELLAERQSKVAQLESELERIDREWHMAREKIQGNLPPLRPTTAKGGSGAGGIFITLLSLFSIAMVVDITGVMPNEGPFSIAKVAFPLFGLCLLGFAIAAMVKGYSKADQVELVEKAWQAWRELAEEERAEKKAWQERRWEVEARLYALLRGWSDDEIKRRSRELLMVEERPLAAGIYTG
jgi:hypothetical protein